MYLLIAGGSVIARIKKVQALVQLNTPLISKPTDFIIFCISMRYEAILQEFSKQDNDFLWACVEKFRDECGEAMKRKDKEGAELARKQLRAVKEILLMRQ